MFDVVAVAIVGLAVVVGATGVADGISEDGKTGGSGSGAGAATGVATGGATTGGAATGAGGGGGGGSGVTTGGGGGGGGAGGGGGGGGSTGGGVNTGAATGGGGGGGGGANGARGAATGAGGGGGGATGAGGVVNFNIDAPSKPELAGAILNGVFANDASSACCCSGLIAKGFAPKLNAGICGVGDATGGATGARPDRKFDLISGRSKSTLCWAIFKSPPAGFFLTFAIL